MRPTTAQIFREFDAVTARRAFGVRFSVTVELADATWIEYHATTEDHARTIAARAVELLGARGASCWNVRRGGTLARRSFHMEFNNGDHYGESDKLEPDDYAEEEAREAAYFEPVDCNSNPECD